MTPRSSTRRCRTGTRATRGTRRHLQFRDPSAATAAAATPRSPGLRSRRGPRSPEVPVVHPARGGLARRVLLDRGVERHAAVDSGTKMIHLGKNTTSRIISKGISAGRSQKHLSRAGFAHRKATARARNYQQRLAAHRRQVRARTPCPTSNRRTRAPRSSTSDDDVEDLRGPAVLLHAARPLRGGGHRPHRQRLRQGCAAATPMEFAVEAQKLISISLEGSAVRHFPVMPGLPGHPRLPPSVEVVDARPGPGMTIPNRRTPPCSKSAT